MQVDQELWAQMQVGAEAWMSYLQCGRCLSGLLGVAAKTGGIPAKIDLLWNADPKLEPYRDAADSLIESWKEALADAPTLTDEKFRTLLVLSAKLDDRRLKILQNLPLTDWEIVKKAASELDPIGTITGAAKDGADYLVAAADAVIEAGKKVVKKAASGLMTAAYVGGALLGGLLLYQIFTATRRRS